MRNSSGQLGTGDLFDRTLPVQVQAPTGVTFTQFAAGVTESFAIASDGNAYAWGYNGNGRLGDGTTTSSFLPVQVQAPAGVNFTQVDAGEDFR